MLEKKTSERWFSLAAVLAFRSPRSGLALFCRVPLVCHSPHLPNGYCGLHADPYLG
jgi:hypothetical protein